MLPGQIGLFASRDLSVDTIIADAQRLGEIFIPWIEYKLVDDAQTQYMIEKYCLRNEDGFYVPENFNYMSVPWNMNHSCDYNVGFDEYGNFVTARNVKAGEELFWDYGRGISYSDFNLACRCGSKNCRKIITGSDWKNLDYMRRNKKYFMRELLSRVGPDKLI